MIRSRRKRSWSSIRTLSGPSMWRLAMLFHRGQNRWRWPGCRDAGRSFARSVCTRLASRISRTRRTSCRSWATNCGSVMRAFPIFVTHARSRPALQHRMPAQAGAASVPQRANTRTACRVQGNLAGDVIAPRAAPHPVSSAYQKPGGGRSASVSTRDRASRLQCARASRRDVHETADFRRGRASMLARISQTREVQRGCESERIVV